MAKTSVDETLTQDPIDVTRRTLKQGQGPLRTGIRPRKDTAPYNRPRNTRRRTVSSGNPQHIKREEMSNPDMIMDETVADTPSSTARDADKQPQNSTAPKSGADLILDKMNAHFNALNENQNLTNQRIGVLTLSVADMSSTVGVHSEQIEAIQRDIKTLQARPLQNVQNQVRESVEERMAATETVLDDKLHLLVNKKLESVSKEMDKIRAIQAVQAQTNAKCMENKTRSLATGQVGTLVSAYSEFDTKFLECRRSVRLWPIDHSTEQTLWTGVRDFFFDKLSIPHTNLPQEAVESVVRVLPGRKKRKIESEVIVKFASVQVRDMVVSYAPNLRAWREKDGSGRSAAGLRLEIPDHLMSVFKTLERYGHYLKDRYKDGLRRHIRYDDYSRTLVMDYALPGSDKWDRIDFDNAREELRQHAPAHPQRFSSSSAADVAEAPKAWTVPDGAGESGKEAENESAGTEEEDDKQQDSMDEQE